MTDSAMEEIFETLKNSRPPWYNEDLEYQGMVPGTFSWRGLSAEAVWKMFVDFYKILEGKKNEGS